MSVKFHFLNVGDGDCTIIDFPERQVQETKKEKDARVMMVDIHHHDDRDEYEHVIDYYKKNFQGARGLRPIFRYVMSHPHMDHMKGLRRLSDEIKIYNFWDIDHEFEPEKTGDRWETYKEDWERYEQIRAGNHDIRVLKYADKTTPCEYWNEDCIEILSPSEELYGFVHKKEDGALRTKEEIGSVLNNLSHVLLIRVNNLKILLAGDAEPRCWEYILKNYKERIKNIDILKAPHHGRESAFHEEAVKIMNPKHIIFSASENCDNLVPEKYKKVAPNSVIYNTYDLGSFILECDFEGNIKLS